MVKKTSTLSLKHKKLSISNNESDTSNSIFIKLVNINFFFEFLFLDRDLFADINIDELKKGKSFIIMTQTLTTTINKIKKEAEQVRIIMLKNISKSNFCFSLENFRNYSVFQL